MLARAPVAKRRISSLGLESISSRITSESVSTTAWRHSRSPTMFCTPATAKYCTDFFGDRSDSSMCAKPPCALTIWWPPMHARLTSEPSTACCSGASSRRCAATSTAVRIIVVALSAATSNFSSGPAACERRVASAWAPASDSASSEERSCARRLSIARRQRGRQRKIPATTSGACAHGGEHPGDTPREVRDRGTCTMNPRRRRRRGLCTALRPR